MRKGSKFTPEQSKRQSEGILKSYREGRRTTWTKGKPGTNLGKKFSTETRKRMSESMRGIPKSEAHKAKLAVGAVPRFHGGNNANDLGKVLEPVGFIREHHVTWGTRRNERFILDFAHVEGKVNIELDGPSHDNTQEHDALRDHVLTTLGWRIIRIKHRGSL